MQCKSNNLFTENDIKFRKCKIPRAAVLNMIFCASFYKEKHWSCTRQLQGRWSGSEHRKSLIYMHILLPGCETKSWYKDN
jgi:hypothetical protein